ncbi:acyl carrier protein [Cytophagales bacterium LB-30]|uniref:Acyl carrier protein n=1 Tax=Shiella aurantiaca TaxID=3058365 RepID=A0ABT8F3L8_9BACT|nr:acyl carrier protein [Shiella aurantiaca]MDN4164816.1 acyl carrier protein [Shiella aurantiaca]
MKDIEIKIKGILMEKLGIKESEITPEASFIKDLGIDSLDYAELVMEFEQTFNIRIPDEDAEQLQTLALAAQYIQTRLQ